MKNKFTDLNNYLFEQIERITDDSLKTDELDNAIKKAEAVTKIAETIIKNGEVQLKTASLALEYGMLKPSALPAAIPNLLESKNYEGEDSK